MKIIKIDSADGRCTYSVNMDNVLYAESSEEGSIYFLISKEPLVPAMKVLQSPQDFRPSGVNQSTAKYPETPELEDTRISPKS